MSDQRLEADARLHPFVEQRAAIEVDDRQHLARQGRRLLADRAAGIEAGQLERILHPELSQHFLFGEVLDPDDHAVEMRPEQPGSRAMAASASRSISAASGAKV
jgi:hypothetical protein